MTRLLSPVGMLLIAFVTMTIAVPTGHASVFDLLLEEAQRQVRAEEVADEEMVKYVQRIFEEHPDTPRDLSEEDVMSAAEGDEDAFCASMDGSHQGCISLMKDILFVIEQENEARVLADELLAIASASELASADEPSRPLSIGPAAQAFNAVWSGTGAQTLGWPDDEALGQLVMQLKDALDTKSPLETAQAVKRYHFGLFRGEGERLAGDTGTLHTYAQDVGDILLRIARHPSLLIGPSRASGSMVGEYTPPSIGENIALWAREDDIGIHEIYPTHLARFDVSPARSTYPAYGSGLTVFSGAVAAALSYPFEYRGPAPSFAKGVDSPLCDRASGRFGYLCRPLSSASSSCAAPSDSSSSVLLTTCAESSSVREIGPTICSPEVFSERFLIERRNEDGTYEQDSSFMEWDAPSVCSPLTRVTYDSSLATNACYIGACLAESWNEHSLIGNRNPIAVFEPSSPYQACMRDDPQIGVYAEMPPAVASSVPPYEGPALVRALDREYCGQSGQAFPGFAGLCEIRVMRWLGSPQQTYATVTESAEVSRAFHGQSRAHLLEAAYVAGQRFALDQALPVYRHLADGMAHFVQETADLLIDLTESAPLTTTACPWTGTLPAEACGTPLSP